MDENFLQYLWQYQRYANTNLQTTDGDPVEILYPGDLNTDAGPDFFNAKIRIGSTLWAGNVEIHKEGKDWYTHGHDTDPAYNNVILHLVEKQPIPINSHNGEYIPNLILELPEDLSERYQQFLSNGKDLPCEDHLDELNVYELRFGIEKLLTERFEDKYKHIKLLLEQNSNDWETVFYHAVAEVFGGTVNKQAFLLLTQSIPLTTIAKLKGNKFQIEALLFGMSGLLEDAEGEYAQQLVNEFTFLKKKYSLEPWTKEIWKFARMRPASSPFIRLAQFADLMFHSSKLFSKAMSAGNIHDLQNLFSTQASEFWDTHYSFSSESKVSKKQLTDSFIDLLIINAVVPVKFAHAQYTQNTEMQEQSLLHLEQIKPETNSIVTFWKNHGVECKSAYDSQALIQLNKVYCKKQNCIRCSIGNKLIRESKTLLVHDATD